MWRKFDSNQERPASAEKPLHDRLANVKQPKLVQVSFSRRPCHGDFIDRRSSRLRYLELDQKE
jgi:hypothetical protein